MEYRVRVREVMNNQPIKCTPDNSVFDAIQLMNRTFGGFLPVVDNEKLVGVLSRGDVLKKAVAKKLDIHELKVIEIMQPVEGSVMIDADADVTEAMRVMGKRKKKACLSVTEKNSSEFSQFRKFWNSCQV